MNTRIISFYSDFDKNKYYENKAVLLKEKCKLFNVKYFLSKVLNVNYLMCHMIL